MSPRLEFALDLVHRAGRGTLAHFQTGTPVETKDDCSPVTIADREAEALIRKELSTKYPGEGILGEEEGESGAGSERRWVVDPIDGTKSFICGVPLFATLLSYEVYGYPTIGVCYFPAIEEMLYAELEHGAWLNGRPARVSARATIDGSVLCCGGHRLMADLGHMEA